MSYRVTLVVDGQPPFVIATEIVGEYPTISAAMTAAKRAAGRRARYSSRGVDSCYVGPDGTAWIGGGK